MRPDDSMSGGQLQPLVSETMTSGRSFWIAAALVFALDTVWWCLPYVITHAEIRVGFIVIGVVVAVGGALRAKPTKNALWIGLGAVAGTAAAFSVVLVLFLLDGS